LLKAGATERHFRKVSRVAAMSPQPRQVLYPSSARFLLNLFEHLIQLDIDRMIPRGAGRVKFFMKNKSFFNSRHRSAPRR